MIKRYSLLLLFSLGIMSAARAQTNRALVVTIGQYPRHSGWERIHAENDGELVKRMLMKYRYLPRHIVCLSDSEATKENVTEAIARLHADVCPGDYIYLHFSCHGQQMMDDNGDEDDGLDESIVLYDALFWYIPGKYEGENHLRDDELGEWIDKIREKAGESGQLMVVIDACHSGTANRENEEEDYIRGTNAVFAPKGYVPKPGEHQERSRLLLPKRGFSPAMVFSACLPEEINYEYYDMRQKKYFGKLTFFLWEIIEQANNNIGINDLMSRLKSKIYHTRRRQTPYMECTSGNMTVKTGTTRKR